MRIRPGSILFMALAAGVLCVKGCGTSTSAPGKPVVVCTIFAYYDAARAIAGDKVEVKIILPRGQSPHDHQATAQNKTDVYYARLYVKNDLGLDDRFDGLLDGSKAKVLNIGKLVDAKSLLKSEETEPAAPGHAHHDHGEEGGNPHIWLDPRMQMAAAEKIRDAIIEVAPADAAFFKANAEQYLDSLRKLDADFADAAKNFKTREFIGFHTAYDYLAHRYGLVQIAAIEEVPGTGLTVAQTE